MTQSASASGKSANPARHGAAGRKPTSPHLEIWRWHPTMAVSIFHRASGIALAGALIGLLGWILAVLVGDPWYALANELIGGIAGKVILFLTTLAFFFHAANGIRHLFWDSGLGFAPKTANRTAWLVMIIALGANLALWRDWFFF